MGKTRYWHMAFKEGDRGPDYWDYMRREQIAAISYTINGEDIPDLSKVTVAEYEEMWAEENMNTSAKNSLKKFRYEMDVGNVIYVKDGVNIVGKGYVEGIYKFSRGRNHTGWEHFRRMIWETDFTPFHFVVKNYRHTVWELEGDELKRIQSAEKKKFRDLSAKEGELDKRENNFRTRNGPLIEEKKARSDYCCEVCGMSFEKVYGEIGEGYIIAHHLEPLGLRKKPSKTSLDDLSVVCANCHAMLHKGPPFTISEIRRRYQKRAKKNAVMNLPQN